MTYYVKCTAISDGILHAFVTFEIAGEKAELRIMQPKHVSLDYEVRKQYKIEINTHEWPEN